MKPFFVVLLLAFVTWTFVQFVNSCPTLIEQKKSPVNTNYGGVPRKQKAYQRKGYGKKNYYLWPNGEIPYDIVGDFVIEEWCQIKSAMYHIMWNSCIRFRESKHDRHWLMFAKYTRCVSSIGFNREINDGIVALAPGCFNMQTIVHEILHSIGFWDEASPRLNRKFWIDSFLSNENDNKLFCSKTLKENSSIIKYRNDGVLDYNISRNSSRHELSIRNELDYISEYISQTQKLQFLPDKAGLLKLDVKALNKLYKCVNPLRPSYDFIREFAEHRHRCVGVIYNDTISNNSLVKNQVTFKSNKKRSTFSNEINETIVQGDILINVNQTSTLLDGNAQSSAINPAITVPHFNRTTWTNGTIPYELDSSLEAHKCIIENAMLQIMLNTCIRFRPRNDSDTFYVRILQDPRHSCYAYTGMDLQNYVTKVSLPDGCLDIGTVVHELVHAIGFYHHQNRHDRDQHLKIHEDNIQPNMNRNFKLNDPLEEQILTPWDYDSVMLYGAKFFSKDDQSITMEPTVPGVVLKDVFDKPGLSRLDALAINKLYKCSNVSNPQFYSDLSLLKPMLKLVKSCNSSSPENVKSYQYIFK